MDKRKFNDQETARRNKLSQLQKDKNDPFAIEKFKRNHNSASFIKKYDKFTKGELHENNDEIIIAGRIMAIRQTFGVIKDFFGTVQFYINKNKVDEKTFKEFKQLDLGDIVGVYGTPMKTNTGMVTINVKKFVLLSKALRPLPEKYHGLVDEEARARHRYVDLIMNDESMNAFILRARIFQIIREFMNNEGYLEVETPVLQPILGGAAARPFTTHHNTLDRNYYLRIATELPLKKLIAGGFDKVYEIGRIFRNEGMDAMHNPEFTSMEAYAAYQNLDDMMDLAESLFKYIAKEIKKEQFEYKGTKLDFSKKFERIRLIDVVKKYAKVDFDKIKSDKEAVELAKKHHIELAPHEMK